MTALVAKALRLSTSDADFEAKFQKRLHWSADADAAIESRVAEILADVQQRGDAAVLAYTQRFDGLTAPDMQALMLTQDELKAAFEGLPAAQKDALQAAAKRVRTYHEAQKKASGESWSYTDEDGTLLGQKVTPLDRVGIYVPGGKAAYPSSVLMNAIPAHVAGVQDIIMVVPTPQGVKNPLVLAAAYVAGVSRAFTIGGAQAVAALAYGTDTVPKVDKITGPGNAYVASAKKRCWPMAARRLNGWPWICSRKPNTTNWRKAFCCAPMLITSTKCKRLSIGCCPPCRVPPSLPSP
jgi:histidinol dehydrogenase